MLQFCVLGPIEIRGAKRRVRPQGRLQCTLLATLLSNGNELVTTAVLISEMWDERPPDRVENALQAHVSRLRRLFTSIEPDTGGSRIITHASGYQLSLTDCEVDGTKFLRGLWRQVATGDQSDSLQAARELREMLALWRGPVFGGPIGGVACRAAAARYDEARLAVLERLLEPNFATAGTWK